LVGASCASCSKIHLPKMRPSELFKTHKRVRLTRALCFLDALYVRGGSRQRLWCSSEGGIVDVVERKNKERVCRSVEDSSWLTNVRSSGHQPFLCIVCRTPGLLLQRTVLMPWFELECYNPEEAIWTSKVHPKARSVQPVEHAREREDNLLLCQPRYCTTVREHVKEIPSFWESNSRVSQGECIRIVMLQQTQKKRSPTSRPHTCRQPPCVPS